MKLNLKRIRVSLHTAALHKGTVSLPGSKSEQVHHKYPETDGKPRAEGEASFHSGQCPSWGSGPTYQGTCQNKYDSSGTGAACPLWASCSSLRLGPHNAGFFPTRQPSLMGPESALAAVGAFLLSLTQLCLQLHRFLKTSLLNTAWVCPSSAMVAHPFRKNSGLGGGMQMPPRCHLSLGVFVHCPTSTTRQASVYHAHAGQGTPKS